MKITFKNKPLRRERSLLFQYGTVKNDPIPDFPEVAVVYRARRNRITGAVWIKLRICGWSKIEQPELFVKE